MPDEVYWESTITTYTVRADDFRISGASALTTIYTPVPACVDRWFQSSSGPNVYQCGINNANLPVDPRFQSCAPYSQDVPTYSPGICPSGYGMAWVGEYRSGNSRLGYGAYCCRSGMTFLGDDTLCHSTFTTPMHVFIPVTTETDDQGNKTVIYEASASRRIRTITTGTAWECPWGVVWEEKDLSVFPSAYATSLTKKINALSTPSAAPASSSSLPKQTAVQQTGFHQSASQQSVPQQTDLSLPISCPRLSSGAKAGISIGALAGATFLIGIAIFFVLRRRRRRTPLAIMDQHDELMTKTRW